MVLVSRQYVFTPSPRSSSTLTQSSLRDSGVFGVEVESNGS